MDELGLNRIRCEEGQVFDLQVFRHLAPDVVDIEGRPRHLDSKGLGSKIRLVKFLPKVVLKIFCADKGTSCHPSTRVFCETKRSLASTVARHETGECSTCNRPSGTGWLVLAWMATERLPLTASALPLASLASAMEKLELRVTLVGRLGVGVVPLLRPLAGVVPLLGWWLRVMGVVPPTSVTFF
eukprot:SAG22_NODE_71_length_22540_cov_8.918052_12_plen_184_part_00